MIKFRTVILFFLLFLISISIDTHIATISRGKQAERKLMRLRAVLLKQPPRIHKKRKHFVVLGNPNQIHRWQLVAVLIIARIRNGTRQQRAKNRMTRSDANTAADQHNPIISIIDKW